MKKQSHKAETETSPPMPTPAEKKLQRELGKARMQMAIIIRDQALLLNSTIAAYQKLLTIKTLK